MLIPKEDNGGMIQTKNPHAKNKNGTDHENDRK